MIVSQQHYTVFETPEGFAAMAWSRRGICGLRLPSTVPAAAEHAMLRRLPSARRSAPPAVIACVIEDVQRYFSGQRIAFTDVPVDLGEQVPFFNDVYARVRELGWGQTTTYGSIARDLGAEPQAARDVGQAMATNPVPLIVPCHRVLAAGGKIGGFSAPGGPESKARMLKLEGVSLQGVGSKVRRGPPIGSLPEMAPQLELGVVRPSTRPSGRTSEIRAPRSAAPRRQAHGPSATDPGSSASGSCHQAERSAPSWFVCKARSAKLLAGRRNEAEVPMSEVDNGLRRFRVRARHEDIHHGRVLEEPSFEAAAVAYAEHLPVHADEGQAIGIIVHDLESGHEHSFMIHHGDATSA